MSLLKRLQGDAYLGYRALLVHPLKKLLSRDDRPGKQRFLDNYASEGLVPTSDEDRRVLAGAARCINCGLCEFADLALGAAHRVAFNRMSLFATAYTRMSSDAPSVLPAVRLATDESLAAGERVCPTRVPLRALVAYLRRKSDEVARATVT